MESYINESTLPYPFCPGCGHGIVVDQLNNALVKLQLDPKRVVIVTDIGCSGLSDKFFVTNAFHGLHGRSVTYATGMKLIDPGLKVIVLIGDGGCGIGGNHLIHAARRNVGVTVLVFNNFNYGMTGGEHSVTTPLGAITATSRYGHIEHPMDICSTVAVNGASFVARTTSFDKKILDLISEAIQNDGFSLIDIWELCTAHYVPNNSFSKKKLEDTLVEYGFSTGIIHQEKRIEFSQSYKERVIGQASSAIKIDRPIHQKYKSNLTYPISIIIAGAAGKKTISAATMFCHAAMLSGLWVTQRNEYPVTLRSGYSISEVIISPEEINFTGVSLPDVMIVPFEEGLEETNSIISSISRNCTIYINGDLSPISTQAQIVFINLKKTRKKKEYWTLIALAKYIHHANIFPLDALREAISLSGSFARENLDAIDNCQDIIFDTQ